MTEFFGKRWHDMGGDPAGSINPDEHDFALWEKRVDALMVLTSAAGLMTTDSLRRVLEDMGPDAYETMTYYERWIASVAHHFAPPTSLRTVQSNAASVLVGNDICGFWCGGEGGYEPPVQSH